MLALFKSFELTECVELKMVFLCSIIIVYTLRYNIKKKNTENILIN